METSEVHIEEPLNPEIFKAMEEENSIKLHRKGKNYIMLPAKYLFIRNAESEAKQKTLF